MDEDNELLPVELGIHELTPLDFCNNFNELEEESNQIKEAPLGKKGRPRGLKNDTVKSKKSKERLENPLLRTGHWAPDQNKRYHWFLQINNKHFIHKHLRRMDKIFKTMANFVGTREAEQCRSHHQKMEKKYHTFLKILHHLRTSAYETTDIEKMQGQMQASQVQILDDLLDGDFVEKHLNSSVILSTEHSIKQKGEQQEELPKEAQESFRPEFLLNEDYSRQLFRNFQ